MDLESCLRIINLIIGSLFTILAGTLAVLTYLRARKTILQPINTEIFKLQVKELSTILSLFVGQTEHELFTNFGFEKMITMNTMILYDN